MATLSIPQGLDDPINARILAISEDKITGFQVDPMGEISRGCGLETPLVRERIIAMMQAGVIRRVRQTLLSTSLARGCLVAWVVPQDRLNQAFDYLFERDPFSGHVVIRSTDAAVAGSCYRLWTTLKVPQGFSLEKHCQYLASEIGAERFRLMPAEKLFVLGVGHVRRRGMEPGSKSDQLADVTDTNIVELSELQWRVLIALKREFGVDEIREPIWAARAAEAGVDLPVFYQVAKGLNALGVVGRFSTFLEHVKPLSDGQRVTRFNALFHWAVPPGREIDTGREIGRFHIMTHAYWREGGPEFNNVNVMGVAHGMEKDQVLAHKQAIDSHLASIGIDVSYTNVFWGGRSEIKPSEISPMAYEQFCRDRGLDVAAMRLT